MTTVSAGTWAISGAIWGRRVRGMERITASTSATASAAETARPPKASTSAPIVSGPRELATFTSCPAALNLWTKVFPMWPTPMMPIFIGCAPSCPAGLFGRRMRQRFQRATKLVEALVGELAGRLDLVGDAPDLGFEGAATGGQVDHHAAFVGGVARPRDQAGGSESFDQRRDRARVHVEAGPEGADGKWRAIQQFEDHEVLGEGQAQRRKEGLVHAHHPIRRAVKREGKLCGNARSLGCHFLVRHNLVH